MKLNTWVRDADGHMGSLEVELDVADIVSLFTSNFEAARKDGSFKKFVKTYHVSTATQTYRISDYAFKALKNELRGKLTRNSWTVTAQKKMRWGWAERTATNSRYTVKKNEDKSS